MELDISSIFTIHPTERMIKRTCKNNLFV